MKTYKVNCEYYLKAKNQSDAINYVKAEIVHEDYFEKHIMVNETKEKVLNIAIYEVRKNERS